MRTAYALPDLPLPVRLVIAAFLSSVGLGYLGALGQLVMQHGGGKGMPTREDVIAVYHGSTNKESEPDRPSSQLRRLIATPPDAGLPWNGTGSMSPAFFQKSTGWNKELTKRPEAVVRAEREGERQALLAWIDSGAPKAAYEADAFAKPALWHDQPITPEYQSEGSLKIASILEDRCLKCHQGEGGEGKAALDTYDGLLKYLKPEKVSVGRQQISLERLTQSTHVHLLGFSMLYGLTGLIFAFTSYPAWLRATLGPFVLIAQMLDVASWWLARLDGLPGELFAQAIMVTGGFVGMGLLAQIVLSLGNLFWGRRRGSMTSSP